MTSGSFFLFAYHLNSTNTVWVVYSAGPLGNGIVT